MKIEITDTAKAALIDIIRNIKAVDIVDALSSYPSQVLTAWSLVAYELKRPLYQDGSGRGDYAPTELVLRAAIVLPIGSFDERLPQEDIHTTLKAIKAQRDLDQVAADEKARTLDGHL